MGRRKLRLSCPAPPAHTAPLHTSLCLWWSSQLLASPICWGLHCNRGCLSWALFMNSNQAWRCQASPLSTTLQSSTTTETATVAAVPWFLCWDPSFLNGTKLHLLPLPLRLQTQCHVDYSSPLSSSETSLRCNLDFVICVLTLRKYFSEYVTSMILVSY